jgi:dihydroflavonol-4-reductase
MVAVTGASGFVGAHVAAALLRSGHAVRALVRDARRVAPALTGDVEVVEADVLDAAAMRSAMRGCSLLFHVAGLVGARPAARVWDVNARGPVLAVEAAAAAGVGRVVVTSTCTTIGPGIGRTERSPGRSLGFAYVDSKRAGERAALAEGAARGVDVVVVNPTYMLGAALDRASGVSPSARVVANYLAGRLPLVLDSTNNFSDVADVAHGHVLAAERGRPGERYLLGGHDLRWPELIASVQAVSGVRDPVLVVPPWPARRVLRPWGREPAGATEGLRMMAQDWSYSSAKAVAELGYAIRPLSDSVPPTVEWCQELIAGRPGGGLGRAVGLVRAADAVGVLRPFGLGVVGGRR